MVCQYPCHDMVLFREKYGQQSNGPVRSRIVIVVSEAVIVIVIE